MSVFDELTDSDSEVVALADALPEARVTDEVVDRDSEDDTTLVNETVCGNVADALGEITGVERVAGGDGV